MPTDVTPDETSYANLRKELESLKKQSGMGEKLKLLWVPYEDSDKHGEVLGDTIIIYDVDEETAKRTLRHEYFDHLVSAEIVKPLIKYINLQTELINNLIYSKKERLVDSLVGLLSQDGD